MTKHWPPSRTLIINLFFKGQCFASSSSWKLFISTTAPICLSTFKLPFPYWRRRPILTIKSLQTVMPVCQRGRKELSFPASQTIGGAVGRRRRFAWAKRRAVPTLESWPIHRACEAMLNLQGTGVLPTRRQAMLWTLTASASKPSYPCERKRSGVRRLRHHCALSEYRKLWLR